MHCVWEDAPLPGTVGFRSAYSNQADVIIINGTSAISEHTCIFQRAGNELEAVEGEKGSVDSEPIVSVL